MNHATRWAARASILTLAAGIASAQTTYRVSVSSAGAEGNFGSVAPSISADGRYVAFWTVASTFDPADTNLRGDVYVHDRQTGTTERVSVTSTGGLPDAESLWPSISADGRFVAFTSDSTNLVPGDSNERFDVFVRDRQLGTTERISVATGGAQASADSSAPAFSADGRFVAFHSPAADLVAGDDNWSPDVFLRDLLLDTTVRVSVSATGGSPLGFSRHASISSDGRYVAFESRAPDVVAGDVNESYDVFVRDMLNGTTQLVSVAMGGTFGNNHSQRAAISGDGRYVAFQSNATNLIASDVNGGYDVFRRDLLAGTTELLSVSDAGAAANGHCTEPAISADGLVVSFQSFATNLGGGPPNVSRVYVRDTQSAATSCLSMGPNGEPANADSGLAAVSADGRCVAFDSNAGNLVPGDSNGSKDVFLRERHAPPPVTYCSGDGTGTACPCGAGAPAHGCPNSADANGSQLVAMGTASLAHDTLVLQGSGMPADAPALYFQGTARVNGGAGAPFGDGLRCAGGTIARLARRTNVGGASTVPEAGEPPVSVTGGVSAPGVRTYQIWYRNAAPFCTPATFNLSNGVEVTWTL